MPSTQSFALGLLRCLCLASSVSCYPNDNKRISLDLFGSKAAYSADLNKCLAANHELFDGHSLEERHKQLVGEQCKPVAFYFVGRHAARNPGEEDIADMNQHLPPLIESIKSSGSIAARKYTSWQSVFSIKENNLVTEFGAHTHRELAKRLKKVYPALFDARRTSIELGNTGKLRTVQSAIEFAKSIDNFRLTVGAEQCRGEPSDYHNARAFVDECYKRALEGHQMEELEGHKVCKKRIKATLSRSVLPPKEAKSEIVTKIAGMKSKVLNGVAANVVKKFGLKSKPTTKSIEAAYDMCRYETSVAFGPTMRSIFCDLFSAEQIEALEYLDDAKVYHKVAPLRGSYRVQSSPLINFIVRKLDEAVKGGNNEPPRAFFGFTHVGTLKKLFVTLGFFDEPTGYTAGELDEYASSGRVPQRRLWRSSLMLPFSANVSFALYRCGNDQRQATAHYKVLTSLAEQAVRVYGCRDTACPYDDFLAAYKPLMSYTMDEVCDEVRKCMGV
jgi:hypothetical protein